MKNTKSSRLFPPHFVCTYDLRFSLLVANGNEIGEHELETIILRLITHALDLNQHNHPFRMKIGGGVDIFTATTTTTPM